MNAFVKSASGLTYCLQPKHIFLNKNRTIWAHTWWRYDNFCYSTMIRWRGEEWEKGEFSPSLLLTKTPKKVLILWINLHKRESWAKVNKCNYSYRNLLNSGIDNLVCNWSKQNILDWYKQIFFLFITFAALKWMVKCRTILV